MSDVQNVDGAIVLKQIEEFRKYEYLIMVYNSDWTAHLMITDMWLWLLRHS